MDTAIAALALTVDSLSAVNSSGEVVGAAALDGEVEDAVLLLTTAFGAEPQVHVEETGCTDDRGLTQWSWGDVSIMQWDTPSSSDPWRSPGAFVVEIRAASQAAVTLATSSGVSVGNSASGLFDGMPANRSSEGYSGQTLGIVELGGEYETGDGYTAAWGMAVDARDGVIAAILAPSSFSDFFC